VALGVAEALDCIVALVSTGEPSLCRASQLPAACRKNRNNHTRLTKTPYDDAGVDVYFSRMQYSVQLQR
jgi:hypothetical protein